MSFFAMPSLMDPEQCRAHSTSLLRAGRAAEDQLKNCLLSAEAIVISDGFVFDNPVLWQLLGQNEVRIELAKACVVLSVCDENSDVNHRFRSWLFRGNEMVNPSVIRGPALSTEQSALAREQLRRLQKSDKLIDGLSFEDYGRMVNVSRLQPTQAELDEFFKNCVIREKNLRRHAEFSGHIRDLVLNSPTFMTQGIPDTELSRLLEYLTSSEGNEVSRSELETKYPNFWAVYERLINNARQLTFASHLMGQIALNPSSGRFGRGFNEAINEAASGLCIGRSTKAHKWSCSDVSFDAVVRVREHREFSSAVRDLSVAEADLLRSVHDTDRSHAAMENYEQALRDWEDLIGRVLNASHAKSTGSGSNPSTERKIAADLASGLMSLTLTALSAHVAGGMGLGLFRLSSLIIQVGTKYGVLGAKTAKSAYATHASLSVPDTRRGGRPTV